MMEWTSQLFLMPALCGITFAFVGFILYLFPPKKINAWYGYRTFSSMRTIERWNFAQKFSAMRMVISGIAMLLISTIGFILKLSEQMQFVTEWIITLLPVFFLIWSTERALKHKFPN